MTDSLNDLVALNLDAREGYAQACRKARRGLYRQWFANLSAQRNAFAKMIQGLIRTRRQPIRFQGSLLGMLFRGWVDLKTALRSGDQSLVEECLRAEKALLKEYDDLLSNHWPADVQVLLERQRAAVAQNLRRLAILEQRGA